MVTQETSDEITRLYAATFNRPPDAVGLAYWDSATDEGFTVAQIAQSFSQAPEFIQDYGALTDAGFVTQLYQNVLGRGPDLPGQAYWVQALATGSTRGAILNDFAQSPENVTHTAMVNAPPAAVTRTAAAAVAPQSPTDIQIGADQIGHVTQESTGTVTFVANPPAHYWAELIVDDATSGGQLGHTLLVNWSAELALPGLQFDGETVNGTTHTLTEGGSSVYSFNVAAASTASLTVEPYNGWPAGSAQNVV